MKVPERARGIDLLNPLTWPWWSLMVLSVLLALVVWIVQAALDVNRASGYTSKKIVFNDSQGELLLVLEYPAELRVGTASELPRPMFLRLSRDGAPIPAFPASTALTTTVSASAQMTYTVSFIIGRPGIVFVNASGESVPLQMTFGPSLPDAGAVYLQRSPPFSLVPFWCPTQLITFTVELQTSSGQRLLPSLTTGTQELEIRLESTAAALVRRFLELVFGPATLLLALASAVATYGLGRWEKRHQELESIRNLIDQMCDFVPEDGSTAYRRYEELNRRVEKYPEMKALLTDRWISVCREDLQRALLALAAEKLKDGALDEAERMVAAVRVAGSKLKAVNWLAQAIEIERKVRSGSPLLEDASNSKDKPTLYFQLYHVFATLREWTCQRLLELARSDEGFDAVFDLRSEKLALGLLNRASFRGLLNGKIESASDDEQRTRLERIKQDLEIQPKPLSPWGKTPPPTDLSVQHWLMKQGLHMDPFRASSAEQEPELERMLYEHPCFSEVVRPGSNVLLGPAGSGKTTARLFFEQHCYQSSPMVWFPVRYELPPEKSDQSLTKTIVAAFGQALIPYIVHSPHTFTSLEPEPRALVVGVLLAGTGSLKRLEETLRVMAFNELTGASYDLMLDMVRDAADSSVSADELQDAALLALMEGVARHLGFEHLYLLVDGVEGWLSRATGWTVGWLQALLDDAPRWADYSAYLKLFLPTEAEEQLPGLSSLDNCPLKWEPGQLLELLGQRLKVASNDAIDSLEALTDRAVVQPDKRLVEAAKGSPCRLIRLGHRLFSVHVRKRPKLDSLTAEDFNEALFE